MENPAKELLIADLEYFGQCFLRNEESGEKRLEFFLTLTTAVLAGLAALHAADKPRPDLPGITAGALAALLVFGVITYLRLLRRNHVTDEYKETQDYIRKRLGAPGDYKVPCVIETRWPKWLRGGLAETTSCVTGALAGLLACTTGTSPSAAISIGVALMVIMWVIAQQR